MRPETPKAMVEFLREAARYFENRDTGGEDKAYWANVYNAENCRHIANYIRENLMEWNEINDE